MVREHQVEQVRCPHCRSLARGTFPPEVNAPAQYGPSVRALGVYLHDYQLLPVERTCEVLGEVWGCPVAEGTLLSWGQEAAMKVDPTVQRIADYLVASPLQHADETGVRLEGKLRLRTCQ
jgi:transposase